MEESHTVIEGAPVQPTGAIPLARGTVLAERYEITRLLGRGGAGVVMQARDRVLGEDIAVKVLRPEHGAETRWIDRLAREVKLARQIRHANVCRVFDFGQSDGHAFLVMELATAGSLRDELARDEWPERTLDERLADARAIADGLAAVHAAGILHRDVTPQNVLRMADGRLVVSDFGLATDADPTASSIHGGTVAYMAPEIARGDRATEASDIWALGVIVHQVVFGRRPSWREGRHGSTLAVDDAELGAAERRVVEICQRCTQERGRHRPRAAEVCAQLTSAAAFLERASPLRGRRGRLVVLAAVAVVAAASARHFAGARPTSPPPSLEIALRGEPASWTTSARVVATIEGRVHAIAPLPDGGRVRVTWGDSRLTEDLDLETGARAPAPGPTALDRPGAPAPSPDGASVAVEGYAAGGQPFVFLGPAAPGARLVPVTAAADPSLASQPRWLADGRAFVYDADVRNVGVFSLDTNRATILPAFPARPSFTTFKAAVADRVLVAGITDDGESQISVFSWPAMEIVSRFDLPAFANEWQSRDGRRLFGLAFEHGHGAEIVALDTETREARRLGAVPNQHLAALAFAGDALVFASFHYGGDIWMDDGAGGRGRLVTSNLGAKEMARGGGHVLASVERGGAFRIVELDDAGHELGVLSPGPRDEAPSILPDGRVWTYVRRAGSAPGFYRCRFGGACARLSEVVMQYATASPDGTRVAYVDTAPQGPRARVVPLEGGEARDVGDASSYCRPVWSSPRTLWVSRRGAGTPEWVELYVGSPADPPSHAADVVPTGRTMRGARDCSDGLPDPAGPTRDDAKIVVDWRSELRVQQMPR